VRGHVHVFRYGATCRPDPKRRHVAALQGKPSIFLIGAIMKNSLRSTMVLGAYDASRFRHAKKQKTFHFDNDKTPAQKASDSL
jgi:hypothetical protein